MSLACPASAIAKRSIIKYGEKMPYRSRMAGYYVIVDRQGGEIEDSKRPVPEGLSEESRKRIVFALTMAADNGCEVVFRPSPQDWRD